MFPSITILGIFLLVIAGWLTNVIWTFHQSDIPNILLGCIGALVPPVGILHGFYLWF